jgi:Domain of unknown function (DUF6265)
MKTLLPLLLFASITATAQKSEQMKWMVGTWKINTGNGIIVEQWQIANDSTLSGKSYFIKNNTDTIPQETIELSCRNGDWHYIPTVKNQNNNQPVAFKIIFLRGTEFISENPAHDFPQRIAYRRIKNQLFASIEGKRNGKYGKQNFDFVTE